MLLERARAGLAARHAQTGALSAQLPGLAKAQAGRGRLRLTALAGRLAALSPEKVLARGYALVTDGAGAPVTAAGQVAVGDSIRIRLRNGALGAEIMEVERGTQADDVV